MKNVMLIIVLLSLALPLSGCGWFKSASVQAAIKAVAHDSCVAEMKVFSATANKIAVALNCTNPQVILADLTAKLSFIDVCKFAPKGMVAQGVVGNIACPIVSAAIVGYAAAQVPVEWGCTVTAEASAVRDALTQVCQGAIPL